MRRRVEEFRDSVGAATVGVEWDGKAGGFVGLEALQERVQERGRKAVDDKIVTFQVCAGGACGHFSRVRREGARFGSL